MKTKICVRSPAIMAYRGGKSGMPKASSLQPARSPELGVQRPPEQLSLEDCLLM